MGKGLVAVGLVAVVVALAVGASSDGPRTVEVTIEHSRFLLSDGASELSVRAGETVRFVVRNDDPIDHELIAGPIEVQRRHEQGTDRHHDGAHGAVSVPAGGRGQTEHTFAESGISWLGCHLPGHWDYGMRVPVHVRE